MDSRKDSLGDGTESTLSFYLGIILCIDQQESYQKNLTMVLQ